MSQPVAPTPNDVQAFPRPEGTDLPERIFEHDKVITGEAVALKITAASPVSLIAAGLIDLMFAYVMFVIPLALLSRYGQLDASAGMTYVIMSLVIAIFIIPAAIETATRGRSIGKWLVGVRIVRDDGGTTRFRHSIVRSLVAMFEIYLTFGSVALISTIASNRQKRLGDILAGTYPVSVTGDGLLPPPLLMDPSLTAWAEVADVSRLSQGLAWRVRQFLNQNRTLAPEHRVRLGTALTNEVMPFVSPPPPAGTHPERFLAAVLIIRRDTEFNNVTQTQAKREQRLSTRLPYGLD